MILKLLDLFCCEGGAGTGYARAGFHVVGVDIKNYPRNPHPIIVADAVDYCRAHGHEYDIIHASPPCQSYSRAFRHMAKPQPMLIDVIRKALVETGKPWIIENVQGAPLTFESDLFGAHGVLLCGTMFGLQIYRHRLFETSFSLPYPPAHNHSKPAMNPFNNAGWHHIRTTHGIKHTPEKVWRLEMEVSWMSQKGAREAVPPRYTEWIGRHCSLSKLLEP